MGERGVLVVLWVHSGPLPGRPSQTNELRGWSEIALNDDVFCFKKRPISVNLHMRLFT